ncbi:hypothetical protein C8R47DRAFT_1284078 [Mycena vitilis]|nr:hypothetical protein C8R47DRAFT_1284078 [Mycena vitilis]
MPIRLDTCCTRVHTCSTRVLAGWSTVVSSRQMLQQDQFVPLSRLLAGLFLLGPLAADSLQNEQQLVGIAATARYNCYFFGKWDSVYAQDSYGSLSGWSACLLLAQERSPPSLFVWVTHSSGGCVAGSASFRQPSSVMSGFGVRNDQETISCFIRVLWSLATHRVLRELICWTMLHLESGGTLSHTGSSVPQAAEPDPHRGLRALPSGGNVLAPDLVLSDLAEHVSALTLNCREIPRLLEMLGTGLSHAAN